MECGFSRARAAALKQRVRSHFTHTKRVCMQRVLWGNMRLYSFRRRNASWPAGPAARRRRGSPTANAGRTCPASPVSQLLEKCIACDETYIYRFFFFLLVVAVVGKMLQRHSSLSTLRSIQYTVAYPSLDTLEAPAGVLQRIAAAWRLYRRPRSCMR
jgi:hypothetical protein